MLIKCHQIDTPDNVYSPRSSSGVDPNNHKHSPVTYKKRNHERTALQSKEVMLQSQQ